MASLLLTALDTLLAPPPPAEKVAWLREWDYAHRGLHSAGKNAGHGDNFVPENSLLSFTKAIEGGFGIECDVQRTEDGYAAVFHDDRLDYLTGQLGPISKRNMAELRKIALTGTGTGSRECIPSLEDTLSLLAGRVPILIEIKSSDDFKVRHLCLAVKNALEGYDGPHAVMSFDPRVCQWFQKYSPHTLRGLVMSQEGKKPLRIPFTKHRSLWQAKPDFLALDVTDFPSSFARAQKNRGFPILTWTVKDEKTRERAAKYADAPIFEGGGIRPK